MGKGQTVGGARGREGGREGFLGEEASALGLTRGGYELSMLRDGWWGEQLGQHSGGEPVRHF